MTPDGRGLVSVLALQDVQDKPALFSTFMMWLLARLYRGAARGRRSAQAQARVLLRRGAPAVPRREHQAFLDQVEQVVRLVRSKGVGIFFVTQNPKDVPAEILGQLGTRVQHALRAFTPDDDKALRAAARTFPKTEFYDVEETLTTLGTGEALVSALAASGAPTPPFATRMIPPASRMGVLTDLERRGLLATPQVRSTASAVDRESAHEKLGRTPAPPETPEHLLARDRARRRRLDLRGPELPARAHGRERAHARSARRAARTDAPTAPLLSAA